MTWRKYFYVLAFLSAGLLGAAGGKSQEEAKKLDLHISHFMWWSGPALTNPSLRDTEGNPLSLYHSFKFSTKISPKWKAYFQPRFIHQLAYGLGFQLLNPRVGVSNGSLYKKGNYNFGLNVGLEIPSATGADQKYMQLRISPSQTYSIGKLSLGLGALIAVNIFRPGKADAYTNDIGVALYPSVSYPVSSKVSVGLDGEFKFYHARLWGFRPLLYFEDAAAVLYPNVAIQVAKNITLIPTLAIPLGSDTVVQDTALALQASLLYL